ncbi:MAG: transporter [Phycisphaerales bacterium]|nr:transporter [Phycisphaerales bacterium]
MQGHSVEFENSKNVASPVPTRDAISAVMAGFLGWTLDAFDFFLVVISLPRIQADFHVTEPDMAFSIF